MNPARPADDKTTLRLEMRERLRAVPPSDAAAWSRRICERVIASGLIGARGPVMLYAPLPGEVDLSPLAEALCAEGRRLCLPRVGWDAGTLEPAVADWPWTSLVETRHGLREPPPESPAVPPGKLAGVMVPGLAFDTDGNRLGRGAGFYDRFLSRPGVRARKVGIGFDLQVVAGVPADGQDVPLDAVVTERRVILCRGPAPGA